MVSIPIYEAILSSLRAVLLALLADIVDEVFHEAETGLQICKSIFSCGHQSAEQRIKTWIVA